MELFTSLHYTRCSKYFLFHNDDINFSCHALSLLSAYSVVLTQLMSYHTKMHAVFIFIVPLIFIASTPPSILVLKISLKVCMKILLFPYILLRMNSIRDVVYHKTFLKEGRHWIFLS